MNFEQHLVLILALLSSSYGGLCGSIYSYGRFISVLHVLIPLATCVQDCENEGNCIAPDSCSCPPQWTGQYCETCRDCKSTSNAKHTTLFNIASCSQPCENGGTCIGPNECSCLPQWMGNRCQTRKWHYNIACTTFIFSK